MSEVTHDERRRPRARGSWGGVVRGVCLAAILVVVNGVAAINFIPSSYQQFSWEAYAGVLYPNGADCETSDQCQSMFCVEGTCCNTICDLPSQSCETGTCVMQATAPIVSNRSLVLIVALLVAIGFFALTPLRSGKRR